MQIRLARDRNEEIEGLKGPHDLDIWSTTNELVDLPLPLPPTAKAIKPSMRT